MMWAMNKFARSSIKALYVEDNGLMAVRDILKNSSNRVVFMPVFKSALDYWVLQYVALTNGLDLPFTFGSASE